MNPNRSRRWRAVALSAIAASAVAMGIADVDWGGRPLVSLAFFMLVPGCAVVQHRGFDDPIFEVTVGAALSIAVATTVALGMLAVGRWHPFGAMVVLAALSAPLLAVQIRGAGRGRP